MFYGSFIHTLDAKNRCRIPARLRAQLGEGTPVIAKGRNRCLYIYSASQVEVIAEKLKVVNSGDDKMKALRLFMASMYDIEEDNQKRFTLNNMLKEYASIDKDIVFNGVNGKIEVWNKDVWDEYNNVSDDQTSEIFETLSEYGI